MSRTYTDTFDRANGSLGSIPAGTYTPALPWEVLSGTWTVTSNLAQSSTAPGSNPLAVVTIGKRSNGNCDMYVEIAPQHVYGNAVYARVVDVNNWIRARIQSYTSTYSYYVTEYQHTTYTTEEQWTTSSTPPSGWTYSGTTRTVYGSKYWARASTGSVAAPAYKTGLTRQVYQSTTYGDSIPADTVQNDYRSTGATQVVVTNSTWTTSSTPPAGYTYTGTTRQVFSSCNLGSWTLKSSSTTLCRDTVPNTPSAVYAASPCDSYQREYSTVTDLGTTGCTSPKRKYEIKTWERTVTAQYTTEYYHEQRKTQYQYETWENQEEIQQAWYEYRHTRQVASTYWDTNYEAGVPTRQVGPYYGTDYYYGQIILEKNVAGTITNLGSYTSGSSSAQTLRLTCVGDSITVTYGGTQRISATDSSHKTTGTKGGIGGGTSDYNPTNPNINNFTIAGVSPERVRVGTSWQTMNKKVRVNGAWIDIDTAKK